MPIKKIESVRKRDGTVAPYDEQKIAEAIAKAARASGLDNGTIGRDLASVVTMYLERYHERQTPTSQEIQQLVEKILFDTGNAPISYNCPNVRNGGGTLSQNWFEMPGTYMEVSGS